MLGCNKKILKKISVLLVLCMALSLSYSSFCFNPAKRVDTRQSALANSEVFDSEDSTNKYSDGDIVRTIVTLDGDTMIGQSVLSESGNFFEFASGAAAKLLRQKNSKLHSDILRNIKKSGIQAKLLYGYDVVINAVAIEVKYGDLSKIREIDGVKSVEIAAQRQLLTQEYEKMPDDMSDQALQAGSAEDDLKNGSADSLQNNYIEATVHDGTSLKAAQDATSAQISAGRLSAIDNSSIDISPNGIFSSSGLPYRGEGMLIAVIDSSGMPLHPAFSALPPAPKYSDSGYLGQNGLLDTLNAKKLRPQIAAEELYQSAKIPFGFDYNGNKTDITGNLDHGVHVAGIAAGDDGANFKGSAPNAQLAVLKVYDDNGTAYDTDIIAAIEDAVRIGADVVNLSFGLPAGFIDEYTYQGVFESVADAGVLVCASAGNDYTSARDSNYSSALQSNPDDSTIAYPAAHPHNMAVAGFYKDGTGFDSTSWGTAADLSLKPEIAAPGTSINSAVKNGGYGTKSGSSMATPNIAGAMAVIKQYLKANAGLSGTALSTAALRLATSTAQPLKSNNYFSPRVQGAGFADMAGALSSGAYLTVDGTNKAKLEFGHDPDKTGVFQKEFTIKNFSGRSISYSLSAAVQTDTLSSGLIDHTPYVLDAQTNFYSGGSLLWDGGVSVGAYQEKTIKVVINLSKQAHSYLSAFSSGSFVEGFIFLQNNSGAGGSNVADLSMPFLGFYGDWLAVPIFDADEYDSDGPQTKTGGSGIYVNYALSNFVLGSYRDTDFKESYKDSLPAEQQKRLSPQAEYAAIGFANPGVGTMFIQSARFGLLRNAMNLHYSLSDPVTGQTLFKSESFGNRTKGIKNSWNQIININFNPYTLYQNGTLQLYNNTVLDFSLNASVEYGDYNNRIDDRLSVPLFIDLEQPTVVGLEKKSQDGKDYINLTTHDNHFVRTIKLYYYRQGVKTALNSGYGTPVIAYNYGETAVTGIELSDEIKSNINMSDDGALYAEVEDFARNKTEIKVQNVLSGDLLWNKPVDPSGSNVISAVQREVYAGETFIEDDATYYQTEQGYVLLSYNAVSERISLVIKEGTVRIAPRAFEDATHLRAVAMPKSLKRIGEAAFIGCTNLNGVTFLGMQAPLLEICYQSFNAQNRHPYNHFGMDVYSADGEMSLFLKSGATGFDSPVWNSYFGEVNYSSVRVTFDSMGGSPVEDLVGFFTENINEPDAPTKQGYNFAGWYTDAECTQEFEFGGKFTQDMTLYAGWNAAYYTITYILNCDGTPPVQADIAYGGSFVVAGAERKDYRLMGWIDDHGNTYEVGDEYLDVVQNTVLTAVWQADEYAITFETNGAEEISPVSAAPASDISGLRPADPTRADYDFLGWYTTADFAEEFIFDKMPASDITLFAKWELKTYTITFDSAGGSNINSFSGRAGETLSAPLAPTRQGYKFTGWYTDPECTQKYMEWTYTGNFTLYAGWEKTGCGACGLVDTGTMLPALLIITACCALILALNTKRRKNVKNGQSY